MALRKTYIVKKEQLQEECNDFDSFVKIDDQIVTSEFHSIKDVKSSKEHRLFGEAEYDRDEETDPPAMLSFASIMSISAYFPGF